MSDDVRAWLDAHVNLERGDLHSGHGVRVPAPTLGRIEQLVSLLGDPQDSYPVIHVTGTNGKSSTAHMTAALLAARGLSVGLYTSPHLQQINERLVRNGEPIDDASLDGVLEMVRRVEPEMAERPSFFEIITAAAFSWFADIAVEVAVVEVGLGGMWDATNVADADVAVVTNIGIDHVEYLGPTRDGIAKEKAGIVKAGCILVLGETDPDLVPHFTERAPSQVHARGVDFGVRRQAMAHGGRLVTMFGPAAEYPEVFVPLYGAHQVDNAATAIAAAEAFFGNRAFELDVVREAFAGLEMPGRLEVVGRAPLVVLDGAHNTAGAAALTVALAEEFLPGERTLVVGLLREKEPHEMLDAFGVPDVARVVACRPPSPRALDPYEVAQAARDLGVPPDRIEVAEDLSDAVARALASTQPDGQVVITGSLYTVGAARAALIGAGT